SRAGLLPAAMTAEAVLFQSAAADVPGSWRPPAGSGEATANARASRAGRPQGWCRGERAMEDPGTGSGTVCPMRSADGGLRLSLVTPVVPLLAEPRGWR